MKKSNYEIQVLVGGKPITEYTSSEGDTFVEGRSKSEFTLRIKNNTYQQVEVVVSVDGLSITDGKLAGADSTGYVLNGYQTAEIPGWLLDNATAAKFFFAGNKKETYAVQSTGSAANNGVIGMLVYQQKPRPQPVFRGLYASGGSALGGAMMTKGMNTNDIMFGASSASFDASGGAAPQSLNNVGTGFGDATTFNTTKVNFERGTLAETIVLYYDDVKGLKARGIDVKKKTIPAKPNPFPNMYCEPPKNWNGNR